MEKNKLASISILTYNGRDLIRPCLKSVLNQTYSNWEILIIDNASQDNTVNFIKKNFPQLQIIENKKNIGFSAGHNMGIEKSRGEFILCLNQDVILDKDFIKNALLVFKKNEKVGAVQGKLLRLTSKLQKTKIIDTTGLVILKNRRIINRGQGEEDHGQYDKEEEIFGVDGAVPIYRRQTLEDIKLPVRLRSAKSRASADAQNYNQIKDLDNFGEYFDEDFFIYKEDVDLAWRMRIFDWQAICQPKAVAYHQRGSGDSAATSSWQIIKERRKISRLAKYYSWKNQRLAQIKNEFPILFLKHFIPILLKEIKSFAYILIFEPYLFKAIGKFFLQLPRALKKRKIIMSQRKVTAKEIGKWFK